MLNGFADADSFSTTSTTQGVSLTFNNGDSVLLEGVSAAQVAGLFTTPQTYSFAGHNGSYQF